MTYLLLNGKKLKPFALMEPLEDDVISDEYCDDVLNDIVATSEDSESHDETL